MAVFSINGYDSYSGCDIIVTASLPTQEGSDTTYFTLGSLQTLSVSTHQDKRPVRSLGNINAKDYVMGQRTIAGSLVFAVFDRHFADRIMRAAGVIMPDEIPALNLTVNFANEYGRSSKMAIYGVKLLNEGQVMSINDLYTENTYQFVALGMEPLTADEDEDHKESIKKKPNSGIINKDDAVAEVAEQENFRKSGGKVISDKIKNNSDYSNKEGIILQATIEQPNVNETTGIVTLELKPLQHEGIIYISNLINANSDYNITVDGSNSYHVELPIGFYNAIYMNTTRTRESNIIKIVVKQKTSSKKQNESFLTQQSYPVIENVTDKSIDVSMYNKDFTSIVCYTSGEEEIVKDNNSSIIKFDDLKEDKIYNLYATNGLTESNIISVKTYPDPNSYYHKFMSYIEANKNLLQNTYSDMEKALNSLLESKMNELVWTYNNIVDGIMKLEDSLLKQELMLYAIQFENSMLESYNNQNPYKLNMTRSNVFDTDLIINNWPMTKFYSNKDNKIKLEQIATREENFMGHPNKLYSAYGIDNKISSIKKYITVFTEEGKEFLSKYRNTEVYKTFDLGHSKTLYPQLTTEELYALVIRDNHLCDKQLLEEPYVYEEDEVIYADVNYDNKILLDSKYYLCVTKIYSTLDNMPCRKIAFNRNTKKINLTEDHMPFEKDSIYHIWIENGEGNTISKTFIFNYKGSIELNEVLNKETYTILNNKKRMLLELVPLSNNVLNDIINNLYASNIPKKDIDDKLELALLEYGENSYNVSNTLDNILYETVLFNISNKLEVNRNNMMRINSLSNNLTIKSGTELSTKIITKSYDLENKKIICNIYNSDNVIEIKGDYMAIYLVNDYTDKVLGMLVLNSSNCKYRAIGFNVEVGDN